MGYNNYMETGEKLGKKPSTVPIEFKDYSFTVSNEPLCSTEQIKEAFAVARSRYPELLIGVPEGHPWRDDKIEHETDVKRTGGLIYQQFEGQLSKENFGLLIFIAGVHDTGRPIQAKKDSGIPVEEEFAETSNHGRYSVIALEKWGIFKILGPKASRVVRFAIETHVSAQTPKLSVNPTEEEKMEVFMATLVRDMDKLGWLREKPQDYFFKDEYKKKQSMANKIEGEEGFINPPSVLETFEAHQPINPKDCISYEAHLGLRSLSWIFDINLNAVLGEVVRSRLIQDNYFKYFRQQLPLEESERIEKATRAYLATRGFTLEE